MTWRQTPVRIHGVKARSRANGPGARFVVWFQGCSLGCPGCFNPATHAGDAGRAATIGDIVDQITAAGAIDGVTISGGEPFEQPEALRDLVRAIRADTDHSILVFSGFTRAEIEAMPAGGEILDHIDVLIDGRYEAPRRVGRELRGSANQIVHLLTDRYTAGAVAATPETEIEIRSDGSIVLTGVDPLPASLATGRVRRPR